MSEERVATYLERINQLAPLVREHAAKSERESQLAPEIVEAFHLHQTYEQAWHDGESGAAFDNRARAATRLASVTAVKLAAQAVDLVHDAAGATSIQTTCDIERCWRDVHAMTQHVILSSGRYEVIGRVLFGLEPGSPII